MMADWFQNLKRFVARHTGVLGTLERLERQASVLEEIRQTLQDHNTRLCAAADLRESLRPFAALPMPILLDEEFRPMTVRKLGASPHRTLVCSIPKSGTYLVGRLLELLGLVSTGLHLAQDGLSDYRNRSIDEMRCDYRQMGVTLPLADSLKLVHRGQFTVGHLACSESNRALLKPFKTIFVYRDLRDAAVSLMRFCIDTGRSFGTDNSWKDAADDRGRMRGFLEAAGPGFISMCSVDWLDTPRVFKVSFEQLYGDDGAAAQSKVICELHEYLEIAAPMTEPAAIVEQLVGRPTLTWSGGRSRREKYWDADVERVFRDLRGPELNARLGYAEGTTEGGDRSIPRAA